MFPRKIWFKSKQQTNSFIKVLSHPHFFCSIKEWKYIILIPWSWLIQNRSDKFINLHSKTLHNLVTLNTSNWFTEPLKMDLKAKISIENVINKDRLLVFLKQKLKMEDRSKYLDGTLISSGHHLVNGNQGLGIHFYFIQEMTWTWTKL